LFPKGGGWAVGHGEKMKFQHVQGRGRVCPEKGVVPQFNEERELLMLAEKKPRGGGWVDVKLPRRRGEKKASFSGEIVFTAEKAESRGVVQRGGGKGREKTVAPGGKTSNKKGESRTRKRGNGQKGICCKVRGKKPIAVGEKYTRPLVKRKARHGEREEKVGTKMGCKAKQERKT